MYHVVYSEIEKNTKGESVLSNVEGLAPQLPKIGSRFFMYAKPTRYGDETVRHVITDNVLSVLSVGDDIVVCKTTNALFELSKITQISVIADVGEI